ALLAQGVQGRNSGSLLAALAEMDAEQSDSDGDGIPDLDELRAGSDPNDGPGNNLPVPLTGCAVARALPGFGLPFFGLLLALGWARRRTRPPKIERQNPIVGDDTHACRA